MWRKNGLKFKLSLMLNVMSLLSSCAITNCDENFYPLFPYAGPKVADELQNLSFAEYPNLWDWIGRLNKLKQELEN